MTPPASGKKQPTKAERVKVAKALANAHRELVEASYELSFPEGSDDEVVERAARYAKAQEAFAPALESAQVLA